MTKHRQVAIHTYSPASKYDLEMEVVDGGLETRLTDYRGEAFRLVEEAVRTVFPGVEPTPYIMTGASDSRFFDCVSDQCIRFVPFQIDNEQKDSVHGIDENLDLKALEPAVRYYRYLLQEVQR